MTLAALFSILALDLMAAMSPGPSFVVLVRSAAAEGFRVALMLAAGIALGSAVWAGLALLGLHLLFEVAPLALTAFKIGGGLFLIWIALQTWRHADRPLPSKFAGALPRSGLSALRLGVLTQMANPKSAVFYGAVFVGFVPEGVSPWMLALTILLMMALEFVWFAFVARVFSLDRPRAAYSRIKHLIDRAFGGLMAVLGLRIATS